MPVQLNQQSEVWDTVHHFARNLCIPKKKCLSSVIYKSIPLSGIHHPMTPWSFCMFLVTPMDYWCLNVDRQRSPLPTMLTLHSNNDPRKPVMVENKYCWNVLFAETFIAITACITVQLLHRWEVTCAGHFPNLISVSARRSSETEAGHGLLMRCLTLSSTFDFTCPFHRKAPL